MNYFQSFDGGSARIKGVKTLYFSGAGTFPRFSAGHRNLPLYPYSNSLLRERQYSCLHRIMCDLRSTLGVSLQCKHSCAFLLMVLFLQNIITDWQDENKRTKGPITWWVSSRAEISAQLTLLKFQTGFWNKSSENQVVDYIKRDSARAENPSPVFSNRARIFSPAKRAETSM